LLDRPTKDELRAAIRWVDGHADVWRLFAHPDLLQRCVLALIAPYRDDGVTHVAAAEARGFILGGAAATALSAGFIGIRKAGGHLPGDALQHEAEPDYKGERVILRLQADALPDHARVLIVDDWIETGSQLRCTLALLESAGATVVGASAIVDQTSRGTLSTLGRFCALIRAEELSI
jgi:adenine phosphoribosyltransferase